MDIDLSDYNLSNSLFAGQFASEWAEIESVLKAMPVHVKASDQDGKQGNDIFDPVGSNEAIKAGLRAKGGWVLNPPIPPQFAFLGTDVDFMKNGILVESQFSNYPFFLNNLLRSELFFRNQPTIGGQQVKALVMITKDRMFEASNSTLYYQQGVEQTANLASFNMISIPVRVVGLKVQPNVKVPAVVTAYHAARYSRTVVNTTNIDITLASPKTARGRHQFVR